MLKNNKKITISLIIAFLLIVSTIYYLNTKNKVILNNANVFQFIEENENAIFKIELLFETEKENKCIFKTFVWNLENGQVKDEKFIENTSGKCSQKNGKLIYKDYEFKINSTKEIELVNDKFKTYTNKKTIKLKSIRKANNN